MMRFFPSRQIKRISSKPDVLLILCPPWDIFMPPLGIAYLSTYLKINNLKSSIFDINITLFHDIEKKYKTLWEPEMYEWWHNEEKFLKLIAPFQHYFERYVNEILSTNAPLVGFSVHAANYLFSLEMAKRIKAKRKGTIIVLGGPACFGHHLKTFFSLEKIKDIVDIFVIGEGEETLRELILNFKKNNKVAIPGALFIDNGGLDNYLPRQPIKNLDNIPFPTFKEFPLDRYSQQTLPVLFSRGCISRCSFCNDHRMSAPFRWRSPRSVVEEIRYHLKYNHIHNFSFKDLLCNGNIKALDTFCELVIRKKMLFSWDSQAIPRKEMNSYILEKMKKSGCTTLIYGVESCSDRILKRMKKIFNKEDVKKVLSDTHRAGIRTYVNIIVGFPGETELDFMEIYNFIRENKENIDYIGALSTCLVNGDTDLEYFPQDYDLILGDNPERRARYWQDVSGSSFELRKERAERLLSLLKELGIPYDSLNI